MSKNNYAGTSLLLQVLLNEQFYGARLQVAVVILTDTGQQKQFKLILEPLEKQFLVI